MRPLALSLALVALAAAPSASRAGFIVDGHELTNDDSSSFVNPSPNIQRHFPTGSPSENSLFKGNPTFPGTTTLPFNNAYTYLDPTGMRVGSVASSLSISLSYTQLTPSTLRISASLSDTNEGHTLNNSGWRSTNTAQSALFTEFSLTTPMYYSYHQTSSESATGAYLNVGTTGSLVAVGKGTIISGLSILNREGDEGTVPVLDITATGVLPAGTYEIFLRGLVNGETIFYGGNDFTTTTTGNITLTLSDVSAAPEPASVLLLGVGAAGLVLSACRRRASRGSHPPPA
jgi:hypothetical protein